MGQPPFNLSPHHVAFTLFFFAVADKASVKARSPKDKETGGAVGEVASEDHCACRDREDCEEEKR